MASTGWAHERPFDSITLRLPLKLFYELQCKIHRRAWTARGHHLTVDDHRLLHDVRGLQTHAVDHARIRRSGVPFE